MKHARCIAAAIAIALLGFAAPASATHVQCGDTITQNTLLDSDVECATFTQNGLTIGADNVILNLGGFTLRAATEGGVVGVGGGAQDAPISGVQVRNGTIEGFGQGVTLFANDSLAIGLVSNSRDIGIWFSGDGNSALLNEVSAFTPGNVGLYFQGNDAYATRNTVRGGNTGPGIYVAPRDGDNTANNPRIAVNTVAPGNCVGPGIQISGYDFAVVARNSVTGCGPGIVAALGTGAQVRRNLTNGSTPGIQVNDPAARVWCNTANGSFADGIEVIQPGNVVEENTANDNTGIGINAVEGTIDGGGNAATGNEATGQGRNCINVACGTTSTCTRSAGAGA